MIQPSSDNDIDSSPDHFGVDQPSTVPIIGGLTADGLPIVVGIAFASPPADPMVESSYTIEGEESEQSAEVLDIIDVEVEEEMTLRVFRGPGGGMDIETIAEEEEPAEEEERKMETEGTEGMMMMMDDEEADEEAEGTNKKEEVRVRVDQDREVEGMKTEENEEMKGMKKEEMKGMKMEEDGEEVEVRVDLERKEQKWTEVAGNMTGEQPPKVVVTVVRETVHRTTPLEANDRIEDGEMVMMKISRPTEGDSVIVNKNMEAEASTSTVVERRIAKDQAELMVGMKQNGVGAVQRMEKNKGRLEGETPFEQMKTGQKEWREPEGGGREPGMRMMIGSDRKEEERMIGSDRKEEERMIGSDRKEEERMIGSDRKEEERMLAEGEAMLRELIAVEEDKDSSKQPQQISTTTTTTTTTRREVVIEQLREEEPRWHRQNGGTAAKIVQVEWRQKQAEQSAGERQEQTQQISQSPQQQTQPPQLNQQQLHHQLRSPPLSPNNTSPSTVSQQNGISARVRSPGPHSPFGQLEPPTEEEWTRLSPKTLSRIKRLKVVMDTNGTDGAEVIHHHPVFVKDTSRFWYKPTISRENAIAILKNKPPGTFIVRDSNSFPGAFGLALKVAQPPPGVPSSADGSELVRHFLIEPSPKGVRLKGCFNEPVFGTLSALVYQHSITPLALPCRLILPEQDPASTPEQLNSNQALLERGAACNVTFLCSVDTESLTGPEALRRSITYAFELLQKRELRAVPVHFKVSAQGITLTDNTRSLFFRRHYPVNTVTFAGIDPESRVFDNNNVSQLPPIYVRQAPVFGFVARKSAGNGDHNGSVENSCHLFAELDPDQPASAVVRFITNVMMPVGRSQLQHIPQSGNVR